MLNHHQWNAYARPDPRTPWRWVSSGFTFGEANGGAVLKTTNEDIIVVFGRLMPAEFEKKYQRMP
jgi:hypothetical protein